MGTKALGQSGCNPGTLGDGPVATWGYVKRALNGATIAGSFGCAATGVYDPVSNTSTLIEVVGPCEAGAGQNIF